MTKQDLFELFLDKGEVLRDSTGNETGVLFTIDAITDVMAVLDLELKKRNDELAVAYVTGQKDGYDCGKIDAVVY